MKATPETAHPEAIILNNLLDGVIIVDQNGIILYANKAAHDLFGRGNRSMVGDNFGFTVIGNKVQEIQVYKEGSIHYVEMLASEVLWKGENVFLMSLRDITETTRLTQSLRTASRESERKDEFIAVASHELKTPLTCIKAYTELIEQTAAEGPCEGAGEYARRQNKFINRLTDLINDIIDVSKIRAGNFELSMSPFNFNDFFTESIGNILPIINSHTLEVQGSVKGMVNGDKRRLEQVIANLVFNAVKYSPDSEKIIINISENRKWIKVSFIDFGIGVSKKQLTSIFERFARGDNAKSKFEGLGLGLFISSEIINRHGGKLQVKSIENKGSTFSFWLPAVSRPRKL
ncbi:MAG: sensor histidine kinase [Ginsengibacter sp.]